LVTTERDDAIEGIRQRLVEGRFGDAGRTIVIEEHLDGDELSVIAFTDGHTVLCCPPARDYKRAFDGDRGPNTGGMGSYSPVPSCSDGIEDAIARDIVEPMVETLSAAGTPFVGAIYAGLALTEKGPKVIEFNARFGDPETQALLPRLGSDFAEACLACASGELAGTQLRWSDDVCVAVVVAAGGYPGPHDTGLEIHGLDDAERLEGVDVFHAGTALRDGAPITAGGRVLAVSGRGKSFGDARRRAYQAAGLVGFSGRRFRTDIAQGEEIAERMMT
jgi:phosphoribosylamine--glycine ligase